MYGDKGPPKKYSTPRDVTEKSNINRMCQKCGSEAHWTFECRAGPKSRARLSPSQMLRWGIKTQRREFVPEPTEAEAFAATIKEVEAQLLTEAREEVQQKNKNRKRTREEEEEEVGEETKLGVKDEDNIKDGSVKVKREENNDDDSNKSDMIRRPHMKVKWSRQKRLAMLGLLIWFLLLLICEYQLYNRFTVTEAPHNIPITPIAKEEKVEVKKEDTTIIINKRNTQKKDNNSYKNNKIKKKKEEEKEKEKEEESYLPVVNSPEFDEALIEFERNLVIIEGLHGNPDQPTRDYTDIVEPPGPGIPLPHSNYLQNITKINTTTTEGKIIEINAWEACDQRDADFTTSRDELCQSYLSDINNMRYIKTMSSQLLHGRTIKFRVRYAHNGIEAIIKVSQQKFYFEATSEYLAYAVDRSLNFSRIPTSVFIPFPLDYMKVATAYSPLFSQWINKFVFEYNYTKRNFVSCNYPIKSKNNKKTLCAHVTIQLWMYDVHPALSTFLGLPYEYDNAFALKYYTPGHKLWPPKTSRLRAIGDINDRFIFDFLIGNTDRGMNDHNNFVYGGCSYKTTCQPPPEEERIKGLAKYAFLDHGSSFHSHREPKDNAFFGEIERISICRFRKGTYDSMRRYKELNISHPQQPLVTYIRKNLSPYIFRVIHLSVLQKVQIRLEKILNLVDRCLDRYNISDVFSLPEYWEVDIHEEKNNTEV